MLGGVCIGLAIGMPGIYRNPTGQGVFAIVLIVMTALACVALMVTLLSGPYHPIPHHPIAVWLCVFAVALLLLPYGRHRARDIL